MASEPRFTGRGFTQHGSARHGITRRGVLAAGVAAVAAAGCSSGTGTAGRSSSGSSLEKTALQVGAIQSVTATGLYIARQRGFFAAEGLDVTIVATSGSGPVMAELINGRLDINFGNYVAFIAAQAQGVARLKILDGGNNAIARQQQLVVLPGSPVTSLAALAGKTIGVNALQGVAQLIVSSLLTGAHVPLSSVKFAAIPFPNMTAALAAGRIDAGWLVEPYVTDARLRYKTVTIADGDQGATTDFPISGYACTSSWAAQHPKTAAAFVRALNRGQQLAGTSRPAVEQALPKYTSVSPKVASLVVTGQFPVGTDRAQIQRVADLMRRFGMLKSAFDVAPMTGG